MKEPGRLSSQVQCTRVRTIVGKTASLAREGNHALDKRSQLLRFRQSRDDTFLARIDQRSRQVTQHRVTMLTGTTKFSMCLQVSHDSNLLFLVAFIIRKIGSVAAARSRNRITLLVKFHSEVETHAVQDLFDLVERLLAEVFGGQHLALGTLDQVANGADVGVLETVVRTHAQLQLVHRTIELIVAR